MALMGEPGLPGMAFVRLPRLEMIAVGEHVESGLFDFDSQLHKFIDRKLLVSELKTHHPFAKAAGCSCRVRDLTFCC